MGWVWWPDCLISMHSFCLFDLVEMVWQWLPRHRSKPDKNFNKRMSNILSWAMESLSLPLALDFVFELSSTERTTNSIQLHTLTKFNLASLSANTDEKFSSRDQLIQETEEAQPALFPASECHTLLWNISTVSGEGCCLEMKWQLPTGCNGNPILWSLSKWDDFPLGGEKSKRSRKAEAGVWNFQRWETTVFLTSWKW